MKGFPTMLSFCVAVSSLALLRTQVTGRFLRDLREFRQIGVGARFVADRDTLGGIIRDFKKDSLISRVDLALPHGLPGASYDEESYGEFGIGEFEVREPYIDGETGEEVETYRRCLILGPPFVSGEQHGLLMIFEIDGPSTTTYPSSVNRDITTQVDSVDVDSDPGRETVTYRSGNDMIRLVKEYNHTCDGHVGDDFDAVIDKRPHIMNSRGHFDWGCGDVEPEPFSYCKRLEAYEEEIDEAGVNVCVVLGTSRSTRCPASMTIEEVTGDFADLFSDLRVNVPATSFEGEWVDRVHQTGIIYPCLN